MQRDKNTVEDQKVKAPFQNMVMDEEEDVFQEGEEDDIHCVEDEWEESYLTQSDYEESLINDQVNHNFHEKAVFQANEQNGYNLRSKSNPGK